MSEEIVPIDAVWLRDYLSRHIRFLKNSRPIDPPGWLVETLLACSSELNFSILHDEGEGR